MFASPLFCCAKFNAGYFNAYRHVADEDLDFVVHLGDYIYEAANVPPSSQTPGATSVATSIRRTSVELFQIIADDTRSIEVTPISSACMPHTPYSPRLTITKSPTMHGVVVPTNIEVTNMARGPFASLQPFKHGRSGCRCGAARTVRTSQYTRHGMSVVWSLSRS